MNTPTAICTIITLVLLGIAGYIYLNQEKINTNIEYSNISLSAEFNERKIETGFEISQEGTITRGNTSQSYEKITLQKNKPIKIKNQNIKDQNYYVKEEIINITKDTQRITLQLEKPEEIKAKVTENDTIFVNIYSKQAKNISVCLYWTINYIFVEAKDLKEIPVYENINYNKCYQTNFSLLDSNKTVEVEYRKFGLITQNDKIEMIILDVDEEIRNSQIVRIK